MQTSLAVFLATAVIYFGASVMPYASVQQSMGWLSQAVVATGAAATFLLMKSNRLTLPQAAAVFVCAGAVAAVTSASTVACFLKSAQCATLFPLHATVFSSAFLIGSSGFTAFSAWMALGMPLWAAIVGTILASPVLIVVVMPWVAKVIGAVFAAL